MANYLLMLSSILIISAGLAVFLKSRICKTIPATLLGAVILFYLTGIIGQLYAAFFLIFLLVIISVIYICKAIAEKRFKEYVNISTLVTLGILILFSLWQNRTMQSWDADYFSYWGPMVKETISNDSLPVFSERLAMTVQSYPPFIAILFYMFVGFTKNFSEEIF
jgi:hypothetical protein